MPALLCWNVAGRVRRATEQLEHVVATGADLVCLQEISWSTARLWCEGLPEHGLTHVALAPLAAARADGRARPLAVLTASRWPLRVREVPDLPWPERVLAVEVGGLELVNVHSPISQRPGLVKVRTHEALHAHLAAGSGPRALCGDLNTPRREHSDGSVWTFARTNRGRLRPERGERWDAAERALIRDLEGHGFRDAFRAVHGHEVRELSWEWHGTGGGYRLDHLVLSAEVAVAEIGYHHDWRRDGLSDHSPLYAQIAWPPPA